MELEAVLRLDHLDALSDADALDAIAQLVDHAFDHGNLGLNARALSWSEAIAARPLGEADLATLDYFRANIWAHRQQVSHTDRTAAWSWDQEDQQQQIFFLRRALNNPAFAKLTVMRRCQVLTNLGNQLDTVGRFIEARTMWSRALELRPDFWMARGNRGRALLSYGRALYDTGHRAVFALVAHQELQQAVLDLDRRPAFGDASLRSRFADAAADIAQHVDLDAVADSYRPHDFALGETSEEQRFRAWALAKVLFLNPLNDLGPHPIAARDVLLLPTFATAIDEAPVLAGFFNQLKQEYVSARWLYYEGVTEDEPHVSDRHVLLYNTLDYPALGLAVEKVKLAFRMAYSLLDKAAFFLNRYMGLGIPEHKVNFRSIWREKEGAPVRVQFEASENWPFRGLYWLSRDLFEPEFRALIEPDAQYMAELRNHLEHKYVKVVSMGVSGHLDDDFAHAVSRADLEGRTLHLLRLARAALTYLSLGMHKEEQRRRAASPDTLQAPMFLDLWEDEWKRRL
jgi:hypothetical protein